MAVKFFHIIHIISHITNSFNQLMTLWGHIVEMVNMYIK